MSTKKRLLIILSIYTGASLLYLAVLAIGSTSFFANAIMARTYTYSLFFPIYCLICGIFTRLLSCRLCVLTMSLLFNLAQLIISLYKFRLVYKLNYGIKNLGISYVLVSFALILLSYTIVSVVKWAIRHFKVKKIVGKLASENHMQKSINDPKFLKVYNKKTDRFEKYLVWNSKSGKQRTSAPIIYYDRVEMVAVDTDRHVYAFMTEPEKIKMSEFLQAAADG